MKNIDAISTFGDNKQKREDRVTDALLKILQIGGHPLVCWIFDDFDLMSNEVVVESQITAKDNKELSSRPDGKVSINCNYSIYIESKLGHLDCSDNQTHDMTQLRNHLKWIYDADNYLAYITKDDEKPKALEGLNRVMWTNWTTVIKRLKDYKEQSYGSSYCSSDSAILRFLIDEFTKIEHLTDNRMSESASSDDCTPDCDAENRVMIVGGRLGEPTAQKYGYYMCQPKRTFKDARYISFYFDKRIKYVYEIEEKLGDDIDIRELDDLMKKKFFDNEGESVDGPIMRSVFKLKPEPVMNRTDSDAIRHDNDYAFVQRQRYTTLDKIMNAKKTDDLL